jgi:NitT/TauT family transport system permease protein
VDCPRRPPRRRPRWTPALLAIRAPISRRGAWTLTTLSVLAPLAAWFALSESHVVDPVFLPAPRAVWSSGYEMARSGQLVSDVWATVHRILVGFGLAVAVSAPLGLAMGTWRAAQNLFEPVIGLLRYLPASAFIPLLVVWLGIGESSKVAVLFIGTAFFNTLMTADVVRGVPMVLINASYTLGVRRFEVLRKVIVPHSLPGMIDAIRVNSAAAFNLVVVAELIAAEAGLGYRIARFQRFNQTDKIFAVLIVIGVLGLAIDMVLRLLRNRVGRWVG